MNDKKQHKRKGAVPPPAPPVTDARFESFNTDPRFRLPSRKHTKTTVDKRFAHMFTDEEFTSKARVDRWNRKLGKQPGEKVLRRLYQEEGENQEAGEGDEDEDQGKDKSDDQGGDLEIDDQAIRRELRAADANYDPARQGGYSSSSDSDSDSDSDSESQADDDEEEVRGPGRLDAEIETGEVTRRIAIVNMDWDHIRSADLMALFSSFLEPGFGKIEEIAIYPSEFGKERMRREEIEGPPREVFKPESKKKKKKKSKNKNKSDDDDDDDDSESNTDSEDEDERIKRELITEGADEDFDHNALRSYQLDRLRYYYAVMTCSDESIAQKLYEATDGSEFQSSSNFLDLRFVPDDVTFGDEPRDECDRIPDSYKPVEYVTNALQSSKVKLTWDMDPEGVTRKESIKRAFTGSRAEIEENDLKAYLASDSDDDDNDVKSEGVVEVVSEDGAEEAETLPKQSKKDQARRKMRQALGLGDEPVAKASRDGPVGDMQVTFTAALTEKEGKTEANKEETTIEKYKRKERERKEKKREMARAKRQGRDPNVMPEPDEDEDDAEPQEDLGFDDPFFTTVDDAPVEKARSSQRKEERRKKREAREAAEAENVEQRSKMERIMAEHDEEVGDAQRLDHFDMNEILRAEKHKAKRDKKKNKKGGRSNADGAGPSRELQKEFTMDVNDDRFRAVFEDHDFAIDPSHPRYKPTPGMKQLLEEAMRKRKGRDDVDVGAGKERPEKRARQSQGGTTGSDLGGLVASVKRKAGKVGES